MNNFNYYTPTRVVFGKKAEEQTGELVKDQGCSKVLVHFGGQSAKKSGLLDRIIASLKAEDIQYLMLGGVVPNPRLSLVREGIALCKKESIDFILAVGGGSVIDSAKAIGFGVTNDCDVWDIFLRKEKARACLPIGSVLTIAAAGSEMSDSTVITNEDGWLKRGCNSDYSRCRFAIMNPELTYTLPIFQTMCGAADIIMHTLERYFYKDAGLTNDNTSSLTDSFAEGLLKTVMAATAILKDKSSDYNARAEIMWAGSLSHNGLTGCGNGAGDWATHQLGHELSAMFDVTHGASLSAMWGSWARSVYSENPSRFAKLAQNVFGIKLPAEKASAEEIKKAALQGIKAMENFFSSIKIPTSIKDMDIRLTETQLDELAFKCSFQKTRTIGTFKTLDYEKIRSIYAAAL